MRSKLTEEIYNNEVFWIKLGRILITGLIVLGVMFVLAGPAIGWWVDTRVFPGDPDTYKYIHNEQGQIVDAYLDDEDTYSTTLWLLLPYSIYAFIGFLALSISVGVRIHDAVDTLGMRNPFDPLPVNPADKKIESENPDPATRGYGPVEILDPTSRDITYRQQRS
jgi:hypothetical protein